MIDVNFCTASKSCALAGFLAVRGFKRKSLTWCGSVAAFGVGSLVGCCGISTTVALISFYMSGTMLTKVGKDVKSKIEEEYVASGHRTAWQVLCNGGVAALIAAVRCCSPLLSLGPEARLRLTLAIVAQLAALQGDTWSSELGVLAKSQPRLILGLRKVPAGTNGAVTCEGLAAAVGAGVFTGSLCFAFEYAAALVRGPLQDNPTPTMLFGACVAAATFGSMVDSVLGQLFQRTLQKKSSGHIGDGHCYREKSNEVVVISGWSNLLSNNGVNAATSVAVAAAVLLVV